MATKRIPIALPEVERGLLAEMARRSGLSNAEVVRRLIQDAAAKAGVVYRKSKPQAAPAPSAQVN